MRPVPGQTRHRSVERREAQAPTLLGLRIPGGGPDGTPELRGQAPSQRVCQGSLASSHGVSQTPGASRRSITSLRRGTEKGKGRTRRPKKTKNTGGGALAITPPDGALAITPPDGALAITSPDGEQLRQEALPREPLRHPLERVGA